jgi:hypothetical protein
VPGSTSNCGQRVFGESRADVAQPLRRQVARAAVRIDEAAAECSRCGVARVRVDRHRVDREVAPREVLLERDVGRGVEREAVVARCRLALGAGERVFLVRLRMQEHREVAADRQVAGALHVFRCRADDDPVAIVAGRRRGVATGGGRFGQQAVAHPAADDVGLHCGMRRRA